MQKDIENIKESFEILDEEERKIIIKPEKDNEDLRNLQAIKDLKEELFNTVKERIEAIEQRSKKSSSSYEIIKSPYGRKKKILPELAEEYQSLTSILTPLVEERNKQWRESQIEFSNDLEELKEARKELISKTSPKEDKVSTLETEIKECREKIIKLISERTLPNQGKKASVTFEGITYHEFPRKRLGEFKTLLTEYNSKRKKLNTALESVQATPTIDKYLESIVQPTQTPSKGFHQAGDLSSPEPIQQSSEGFYQAGDLSSPEPIHQNSTEEENISRMQQQITELFPELQPTPQPEYQINPSAIRLESAKDLESHHQTSPITEENIRKIIEKVYTEAYKDFTQQESSKIQTPIELPFKEDRTSTHHNNIVDEARIASIRNQIIEMFPELAPEKPKTSNESQVTSQPELSQPVDLDPLKPNIALQTPTPESQAYDWATDQDLAPQEGIVTNYTGNEDDEVLSLLQTPYTRQNDVAYDQDQESPSPEKKTNESIANAVLAGVAKAIPGLDISYVEEDKSKKTPSEEETPGVEREHSSESKDEVYDWATDPDLALGEGETIAYTGTEDDEVINLLNTPYHHEGESPYDYEKDDELAHKEGERASRFSNRAQDNEVIEMVNRGSDTSSQAEEIVNVRKPKLLTRIKNWVSKHKTQLKAAILVLVASVAIKFGGNALSQKDTTAQSYTPQTSTTDEEFETNETQIVPASESEEKEETTDEEITNENTNGYEEETTEDTYKTETESEDEYTIQIGSPVQINENSNIYASAGDAILEENAYRPYFDSNTDRITLGVSIEYEGNIINILANQENYNEIINEYLNNGGQIVSILTANASKVPENFDGTQTLTSTQINNIAEGFYNINSVAEYNNERGKIK